MQNQTSKPACPASFVLAALMDGNGMFRYVLLKNVDEHQTFCRRKDAMDIASVLKKYRVWGHCVVGLYNRERTHSGKYCFGKTPMQTFLDSIPLAKEKMLNQTVQTNELLACAN